MLLVWRTKTEGIIMQGEQNNATNNQVIHVNSDIIVQNEFQKSANTFMCEHLIQNDLKMNANRNK